MAYTPRIAALIQLAENVLAGNVDSEAAILQLESYSNVPNKIADLVHFIYHFLADSDIRLKDQDYASFQRTRLRALIDAVCRDDEIV